jgi:ABC-2 type transport system permease protein
VRLALAHARAETLQLARYPAYVLPTLALPGLLLLFLGREFEQGEPERLLAGFGATSLLTVTLFQFGVGIAATRTTPWEAYLRTLPVSIGARLGGRLLSAAVFGAATLAVVTVIATTVYDASPPLWRFGFLVLALLVGSLPFALLGIAFGYWLAPRAAVPVANLVFFPLVVSGAFWARPADEIPHSVDLASQTLPTRSWMEILDAVATGDSALPIHHVAALAGWGAVFFALAWWGYRRDEGERFR